MLKRPGCRNERGAVAVLFALLAVVLFGFGAVAVDLGNAYQRQVTVQSQADLGAVAAAAKLPIQADVVAEACRNATLNKKLGQDGTPVTCTSSTTVLGNPSCPTATAGRPAHVFFFATNPYKVKVCSPGATVSFGLARALPGVPSSVDVRASATVVGGTPGALSEMPFYGVAGSGCDYGAQTLTDPAQGQSASGTGLPTNLALPLNGTLPTRTITLTSIAPSQIPVGAAATLRITGRQLSQVTAVGFYRELTYNPNAVEPTLLATADSTGNSIDYTIPVGSPVLAEDSVWYVRVYETGNNPSQSGWSKAALVLRVGDPVISCGSLSNSGNFGALKLPRTDSNASTSGGWMANNIADGLQKPMSVVAHKEAVFPWLCVDGVNGAVYSTVTGTPTLKARTNCVTTDTGLTSTATTAGLITGTPLFQGRLTRKPTSTGVLNSRSCAPGRSSSPRSVLGKSINNDTLSCYLTDPAMTIDTISKASYTGGAVLDPKIFESPRFCFVPIVNYDPTSGRSFNYSVVDVRPCFITGEASSSSWNAQQFMGSNGATDNGVTMNSSGNSVELLRVVFFNRKALPNFGANLGDYIGSGPVSVQMVD